MVLPTLPLLQDPCLNKDSSEKLIYTPIRPESDFEVPLSSSNQQSHSKTTSPSRKALLPGKAKKIVHLILDDEEEDDNFDFLRVSSQKFTEFNKPLPTYDSVMIFNQSYNTLIKP